MALFRGTGGSGASTAFGLLDEVTQQANIAQNAINTVETTFDAFDDIYLGSKPSDPSVDNDGNALQTGALYFNTTTNDLKYYTGNAWILNLNSEDPIDAGNF